MIQSLPEGPPLNTTAWDPSLQHTSFGRTSHNKPQQIGAEPTGSIQAAIRGNACGGLDSAQCGLEHLNTTFHGGA